MKKLLILLFIFITTVTYAAEYPYIMKSTRALGMGNSYYTLSEDQYALFYNPAGLARIDDWRVELINPQGQIGTNSYDFYNDAQDVDWDVESQIADLLEKYNGENQNLGLSAFPAFYKKNLAIGAFMNVRGNAVPHGLQVYPELAVKAYVDYGVAAGYAMSFLDNESLQVGVSLKYLQRSSLIESYTATILAGEDIEDRIKDDMNKGNGVLGDIGIIYNMPFWNWMNPRLGASVNNIGMTDLGDAEDLKTSLNLSMAISPSLWSVVGTNFLLELHDATRSFEEDDDWPKRVHAGAELHFFDKMMALRAGLNQGYITAGAGLDFTFFKVDYAYYTEEIGAYAGQWEDERHVLQVTLGF